MVKGKVDGGDGVEEFRWCGAVGVLLVEVAAVAGEDVLREVVGDAVGELGIEEDAVYAAVARDIVEHERVGRFGDAAGSG